LKKKLLASKMTDYNEPSEKRGLKEMTDCIARAWIDKHVVRAQQEGGAQIFLILVEESTGRIIYRPYKKMTTAKTKPPVEVICLDELETKVDLTWLKELNYSNWEIIQSLIGTLKINPNLFNNCKTAINI